MSSRPSTPPSLSAASRTRERRRPTSLQAALHAVARETELKNAPRETLTKLPERSTFVRRLRDALLAAGSAGPAVIVVDLDGFKALNHELGFETGDRLLVEVADRLVRAVRCGDVVTRLGGDTFALLLEGVSSVADAVAAAQRLQDVIGQEWDGGARRIRPAASVGVAVSTGVSHRRPEDMLQLAERALDRARLVGSGIEAFDADSDARALTLKHLETALRRTVADEGFASFYTPSVAAKTGSVAGFEVLLWRRSTGRA